MGSLCLTVCLTPSREASAAGQPVAVEKLASIETFAFGDIGRANNPSPGEVQFRKVLHSKTALRSFREIVERGTPAAKAYALCGILVLAPAEFDAAAKSASEPDTTVRTMAGCIVRDKKFSALVAEIRGGNYDNAMVRERK